MAKQITSTAVPRVRFPEFRKAKAWGKKPFSRLFTVGNGRDYKHLGSGSVPVYGSGGYMLSVNDYLYDGESVCIGRKGTINNPFFLSGKFWTVDTLFYTHSFRDCLPFFIYLHFQNIDWLKHNEAGGVPSLSKSNIEKIEVSIPSLAEQQKIADCLTSLDEVIAAQGRKVEALKAHKRGLMQQLFPREGETRPRLRFPEFRNAPEWSVHPFDYFVTRSFYGTSSSTSDRGRYPVLRMGNMFDGGLSFSNLAYLDLDPESFEGIRLLPGDILLNRTNSPALVGKISLFDSDIECITASYIVTYRLDRERINSVFCNLMLNTPNYQAKVNALARPSVSQANINPTTFRKELVVSVPKLAEQQRIADCLSSFDAKITAETEQLAALKTHKQGLMQQLFPVPEVADA